MQPRTITLVILNIMAVAAICFLLGIIAIASSKRDRKQSTYEKVRTRSTLASIGSPTPVDWSNRTLVVDSLYQTMKDVHDVLTYTGVGYVIDSGTLLGAVRNKGLIPNDDDLDIRVSSEDRALLVKTAFPRLHELGYETSDFFFGYKVFPSNGKAFPANGNKYKFPFLDIFITSINRGRTETQNDFWPNCYFTEAEYLPTKVYDFGPLRLFGPASSKEYFDRCYGSDWNEVTYKQSDYSMDTSLEIVKVALTEESRQPSLPSKPLRDSTYSRILQD